MQIKRASRWTRWWWGDVTIDAKIAGWVLCKLGFHCWRANCNGWTGEEFESCGRCLKRGKDYAV